MKEMAMSQATKVLRFGGQYARPVCDACGSVDVDVWKYTCPSCGGPVPLVSDEDTEEGRRRVDAMVAAIAEERKGGGGALR